MTELAAVSQVPAEPGKQVNGCVGELNTCVRSPIRSKQVALLSQKGRAMLRVCQYFNSTKRRAESFYC